MALPGNLPPKAAALNRRLIRQWEEGFKEGDITSPILDVFNLVGPSDGEDGDTYSDTVYLFAPQRLGWRKRPKNSNALTPDTIDVYEYVLGNNDNYIVLDVPLNDYKDDKIGRFSLIAREQGIAAATGPVLDMEDWAINCTVNLCYDGEPLCSTAHPVDLENAAAGVRSNLQTGMPLTYDNFGDMFAYMCATPNPRRGAGSAAGGTRPDTLLCGLSDYAQAVDICENVQPIGFNGATNRYAKYGVKVLLVPNWPETSWALIDARSEKKKPFIFQERERAQMVPHGIDPMGGLEYERNTLRWITKGRSAPGNGDWRSILLCQKS